MTDDLRAEGERIAKQIERLEKSADGDETKKALADLAAQLRGICSAAEQTPRPRSPWMGNLYRE